MIEGALEAIAQVKAAAQAEQLHIVGYCVAGTLVAATLAYLSAKGEAEQIRAATFCTTQVDFEEAGELQIFIDEKQIEAIDKTMADKGYFDASIMAPTFNLLRSNDLIWSFVINNYLLGKEAAPFDLLYWNSNSTHIPRALHKYYLTNFYLENNLIKPGKIELGGIPIDLNNVKTDCYIQAGKEDHIAPFPSVYKMLKYRPGNNRFILAGSGHIAGVINPPAAQKYSHWTNDNHPLSAQQWLDGATKKPGSWWIDWDHWLTQRTGEKIPARHLENPEGEDAPGSYATSRQSKFLKFFYYRYISLKIILKNYLPLHIKQLTVAPTSPRGETLFATVGPTQLLTGARNTLFPASLVP